MLRGLGICFLLFSLFMGSLCCFVFVAVGYPFALHGS